MKLEYGTITKPGGKEFETDYGVKRMLIITLDNGKEEKIYFNPTQVPHANFSKGDRAGLVYEQKNGRQIRRLVEVGVESAQPSPQPEVTNRHSFLPSRNTVPQVHQKPDANEWVRREAENLAALFLIVDMKFKDQGLHLPAEEVRNLAVSINIGLGREYKDQQVIDVPSTLEAETDEVSTDVPFDTDEELEF